MITIINIIIIISGAYINKSSLDINNNSINQDCIHALQ